MDSSRLNTHLNSALLKGLSEPEAIKLIIDDALQKRTKYLDKVHQVEQRNIKAICLNEIVQIVRKYTDDSSKQLTNEIHKILKQFIDFKERTIDYLGKMDEWHMRMKESEIRAA